MLTSWMKHVIAKRSMKTGRHANFYKKFCQPDGLEYAKFLQRHGEFYAIGENCYIDPNANITDPAYVKIGNNVRISICSIYGHDGSVNMLNRAHGLKLDNVGRVIIKDNVYISDRCIIQPGVTIESNVIVSAGSVVNRDIAEGLIVAGVPAKPVGTVAMYLEVLKARNELYPWRSIVQTRKLEFDPTIENELKRQRVAYFFPPETNTHSG